MKDKNFLQLIHDRLENQHNENPDMDYMRKLRAIIQETPEHQETINVASSHHHVSEFYSDDEAAKQAYIDLEDMRAKLNEADRRAGAAEREMADLQDSVTRRKHWLSTAKEQAGYHDNVSFDIVWAETLALAKQAKDPSLAATGPLLDYPEHRPTADEHGAHFLVELLEIDPGARVFVTRKWLGIRFIGNDVKRFARIFT